MSISVGRVLIAAAVLAVIVFAGVALPAPASAWEYTRVTGQAGEVWLPPVYPFEDHRFTTYGPAVYITTFDGPYVYRSPATSGAQDVMGVYLVERWNSSTSKWDVVSRQDTPIYTIPAGQKGIYLPRLWRSPGGNQLYNRGYFRVQWIIAWGAAGNASLGSTILSPDRAGDLRCRSMVRPCEATGTSVRLGRTFATGGGW
jgi:hypothetical protein